MMMGSASEYFEMEAAAKTGLPKKLIEEINRENLYPAYLYEQMIFNEKAPVLDIRRFFLIEETYVYFFGSVIESF